MNRERLYDQVVEIYETSGEATSLEQAYLLLVIGDLLNKSTEKGVYTLPMNYYEDKRTFLEEFIPEITSIEIKNLHSRFYFVQKSFAYKEAHEPARIQTTSKEIPWWIRLDALKHGIPDHFKVGPDGAGHGVEEIIHHRKRLAS